MPDGQQNLSRKTFSPMRDKKSCLESIGPICVKLNKSSFLWQRQCFWQCLRKLYSWMLNPVCGIFLSIKRKFASKFLCLSINHMFQFFPSFLTLSTTFLYDIDVWTREKLPFHSCKRPFCGPCFLIRFLVYSFRCT